MIKRRTKGLKVGDTMYSADGIWFPFESIQVFLEYDPKATNVLKGKISKFVSSDLTAEQIDHFDRVEDYQGEKPKFIVDDVQLVSVFEELQEVEHGN